MKASKEKLYIAMARACVDVNDIVEKSQMPAPTVHNVMTGRNVKPCTIGKVARVLGVDVTEILEEE